MQSSAERAALTAGTSTVGICPTWSEPQDRSIESRRWDARRTRFYFHTQPGSYKDVSLIRFLRALKRHFRGQRVMLIWDGLGAHKSGLMTSYLARQRAWLTVERLPAYAPELNPVEQVWGNVKGTELANVCAVELTMLRHPSALASPGSGANPRSRSRSCVTRACRCDMIITLFNEIH
jgi:hypothetical protein